MFVSAMAIDWANTRYVLAVGRGDRIVAANWSVLQWCASLVGFLVAIKITLWMLPLELLGLWCGTLLSMRDAKVNRGHQTSQDPY